jgi:hypothetical protein
MGEILNHINLKQLMIFKYTYKICDSQENYNDAIIIEFKRNKEPHPDPLRVQRGRKKI